MTHFKLVHIASHASHILALVYYIYLYFTPGEIDVESWHCLLPLSRHFLPELDGIAACQCTSPPTCRMSLPNSSPPYETTRRSCDAWCPLLRGPESVQLLSWPMQSSGRISVSANISNSHSPSDNVATPDTLAAKTST